VQSLVSLAGGALAGKGGFMRTRPFKGYENNRKPSSDLQFALSEKKPANLFGGLKNWACRFVWKMVK